MKISALFVIKNGPYFGIDFIDPWDELRDARNYNGPHPVIAHPPCERWGRYWSGGPMLAGTSKAKKLGDDKGCFEAALNAVRKYGGVLEHPEASHAWSKFGLNKPPRSGGWVNADRFGGWTCCVEQGHYGHRARKATWLYAVGCELMPLKWGSSGKREKMDEGFHSKQERRRAVRTGICQRLSKNQRMRTPEEFRDLLIGLVWTVSL